MNKFSNTKKNHGLQIMFQTPFYAYYFDNDFNYSGETHFYVYNSKWESSIKALFYDCNSNRDQNAGNTTYIVNVNCTAKEGEVLEKPDDTIACQENVSYFFVILTYDFIYEKYK